jgi:hypothetical protein
MNIFSFWFSFFAFSLFCFSIQTKASHDKELARLQNILELKNKEMEGLKLSQSERIKVLEAELVDKQQQANTDCQCVIM